MVEPLRWYVEEGGSHLRCTVYGELNLSTAPTLRSALLKCLAEQPDALLVDIAGLTTDDPVQLSVFTAVVRQAARWPGIPVLLCSPSHVLTTSMAHGAFRRLAVFPSITAAVVALADFPRTVLPSLRDDLPPVRGAARTARNLVTDACARWDLPQLVWPASLIASELVSNAIQHAGTTTTLRLTVGPRHLHIAARDGCPTAPVLRDPDPARSTGGRGLLLIQTLAARWGHLPAEGGKVVWATVPTGAPPK